MNNTGMDQHRRTTVEHWATLKGLIDTVGMEVLEFKGFVGINLGPR